MTALFWHSTANKGDGIWDRETNRAGERCELPQTPVSTLLLIHSIEIYRLKSIAELQTRV